MNSSFASSIWRHMGRLCALALGVVAACSSSDNLLGSFGTGGSGGAGGLAPVCATGQAQCPSGCADLSIDEANCGTCGTQCSTGTSCVSGSCQCQSGLTACAGSCVDIQSSAANCGGCGHACGAGSVCSLGQCQATCGAGLTQCGTDCVNTASSVADCGGCAKPCGAGQTCGNGACSCTNAQEKLCGNNCVDVRSDSANCGDCGVSCGANACNAGACATSSGGSGGTGGTSGTGGTAGTGGMCASTTYQGEAMTPSAAGVGQVQGTYFNLWANGSISTTATFNGAQTITVYAGGTAADSSHNPHMVVLVNGSAIGNTTVTPGTTFNPYSFNYTGSGTQTLAIQFDNDYHTTTTDTNLYVDKVVVGCGSGGTGGTGGGGGTGGTSGTGGTGGNTGGTGGSTGGTSGTGGTLNCSGTPLSGGKTYNSNTTGNVGNGYSYQLWSNGVGSGSMTVYGVNATFKASWNGVTDFLARVGLGFDETKTYDQLGTIAADYAYTKTGTGGNWSYIGIYGWSVSPLVEYYIVDDWFGSRPNPGTMVTSFSVDGETYDIYTHTQVNQPSIQGNTTFPQMFSVRRNARQCGHISISQHFSKWAGIGHALGKLEEARLLVEVGGGNGSIDYTTATVTAK